MRKKRLLLPIFFFICSYIVFASDDAPPAIPSEYWGFVDNGDIEYGLNVTGEVHPGAAFVEDLPRWRLI